MVDVTALAAALEAEGRAFVLATVVWCRHPTSARPGDRAVVTGEGEVSGWVGGACTHAVLVREARRALEEGTPRLLRLGPPDDGGASREGRVVETTSCASEGAVEIFFEPRLPRPLVVVMGGAPVARVLRSMAEVLGYQVSSSMGDAGEGSFVVVATMGHDDESALQAALASKAGYVALVASRKRGAVVVGSLRRAGTDEESLARVRTPAGLDLGPIAHEEIAVAVLAEIVQERALRTRTAVAPARPAAVDPVCGMTVDIGPATETAEHAGRSWCFCSPACRRAFEADPSAFAG